MSTSPGPALLRAILSAATIAECPARMLSIDSRDWASATFSGHRHRVLLAVTGSGLRQWLATLPEAEWRVPGHIVVDLTVDDVTAAGDEHHVTLSALTIHDI